MSKISDVILRGVTGAFITNSGVGKIGMPAEHSAGLQQAAASGIPLMAKLPSDKFGTFIGYSEVGIGAALLAPFVPNKIAGAALTAFTGGLLSMYFRNPENTQADGIRPTQEGMPLAKDFFMLAIGLALMTQNEK
ncbi:hypothetical protein [Corynebacterium nasicanis]|uniref:DoxX family protein n=1 Tax=Corynebacterium nasicanis TaxID=1448267 RepID=A0ABW1QDZ6_9CORY